jgi:hypothetical protein
MLKCTYLDAAEDAPLYSHVLPVSCFAYAALSLCSTVLRFSCRNVTDEALEELARIPSLAHITLKGSLATNDGLQHLRCLPRLTHLDLGSRWELDDTGEDGAAAAAAAAAGG